MSVFSKTLIASAMMLGASVAAAQTSADIPTSMQGTYQVAFAVNTDNAAAAPLPDGTELQVVIAPGGALCVAEFVMANPSAEGAEAIWSSPSLGLQLALSDIGSGEFNEINVLSASGAFLGQLSLSGAGKLSNSTDCAGLGGAPSDISNIADVFRLAEEAFSQYFPASQVDNTFQIIEGFIAKAYSGTGTYIGIKDGTVYVLGGEFGNEPVTIGTVANTRAQLLAELSGSGDPDPIEEPNIDLDGDYTLAISGTVSAVVFGTSVTESFSLDVDSIEAPGDAELSTLEDDVKRALADVEGVDVSTFSTFEISEASVSDNRVFYRAKFSATTVASGITVQQAYNLTFEYLKK